MASTSEENGAAGPAPARPDTPLPGVREVIPPADRPDPDRSRLGPVLTDSTGCPGDVPCPGLA